MTSDMKAWLYMAMAAVAGAITSLSGLAWRTMTWGEIFLTLFGAATFAIYVTPWMATLIIGHTPDPRSLAGLTYVSGTGANVFIPMMIKWVKRSFGGEEKQ